MTIGIAIYQLCEAVDGEKAPFRLLSYRVAQRIKLFCLRHLI